jgi:hypothetical protein
VRGHPSTYFADRDYGGREASLAAAVKWRDERWDGLHRGRKLTDAQTSEIRQSREHYTVIAERYGISPNYVHTIRRGGRKR